MKKQIVKREYAESCALALGDALHPLLRRIYAARNIQSMTELARSYAHLHPYDSLLQIDKAASLLADAIMQDKKILIVGDFDSDGATSTTLAMRALKSFGAKAVDFLVPNRFISGYGLTPELVARAQSMKPALILTVDNGIANHEGVLSAKNLNMTVVITDHHLPSAVLPLADAIVNPNQEGDPFPSKNLAGVGVIFYVMLALRRHLTALDWFNKKGLAHPNMSQFLDLVALGTIADLVPLDQNNRILVHHGLQRIRAGQCVPGIIALLELSNRDFREVLASDLGFAVASRLNAAGRLDDMSLGIHCLLSDDACEARELARRLDALNNERRNIERDMQIQALSALSKAEIDADSASKLPRGLCLFDASWHQGVIGILAARMKDRFHRPTVVFACGEGDELKGSARSISSLHIRDTLAWMHANHPDLILKFGGHAMAAGLTIKRQFFSDFAKIFDEVVSKQVSDLQLKACLLSDGKLTAEEYDLSVASLLREAGPWGQAFPEPLFDDRFEILEQRLLGDRHLKLRLKKDDKILDAIAFFVDTNAWPNHRCQFIHAAFRLDINEYKGFRNVQLIVEYMEPN